MAVLERIGSYEVVRLVARGGSATVYEARQGALDRTVAIKRLELRTDDPTLVERFIRESRIAASFDHPNIVTVFDFFECDDVPYIAMEYLPRGSLRPWIGRLPLRQVLAVLEHLLAGLAHAEQHGVAHRDLKPENVLVTRRGSVKIADFGIAKAYGRATSGYTAPGAPVGTPAYMAPEQALGRPVGPYTDLYALGIMAFEMFSGAPPFEDAETPVAALYRHVNEPAPPLPGVSPAVAAWVARLLEKAPEQRPASAAEAWAALDAIACEELGGDWRRDAALEDLSWLKQPPEAASARVATTVEPSRRPRLRSVAAVGVSAAAVAVAVGLATRSPEARRPARAVAAVPGAAPYDFNGDGRPTIVAGLPGWSARGGGVALPHASRLITAAGAAAGDAFGAAVTSADFNRDGRADLAIGSPRRDTGDATRREGVVTLVYGAAPGLDDSVRAVFTGSRLDVPFRSARFGSALAAGDVNRDGYADLAVGAPGARAVQLLFGARRGLVVARSRTIRAPARDWRGFGSVLALADVDRDGHLDLMEGAPGSAEGAVPGHAGFCPGRRAGPARCRAMSGDLAGGPAAMAVGDVTGDRYPDVVHGAPEFAAGGRPAPTGAVLLWPGGARGPSARPLVTTQASPGVPGTAGAGDAFGAAVAVRDLDGDGFADIVVGVPGKQQESGEVVVLRGTRAGPARTGALAYSRGTPGVPGVQGPGHRFGAALTLLDVDGDRRPDLTVAAPGGRASLITLPGTGGRFTGSGANRSELGQLAAGRPAPPQRTVVLGL